MASPTSIATVTVLRDALTDMLTTVPQTPSPPPPLPPPLPTPPTTTTLLSSARLKYVGLLKLPYIPNTTHFDFSDGAFTIRRVNGELRFLVAGRASAGWPVYEFAFPGVGPTVMSAPRAMILTEWGSVYAPMPTAFMTQGLGLRGLHWDESRGQLDWNYGDEYNAGGNHDPCIGTTILNADGTHQAFGVWRTQEHSQKTRGYFVDIPPTFQQAHGIGPVGFGCPNTSGNASSPWGVALSTGRLPPNATPSDPLGAQDSQSIHFSIPNTRLIYHDQGHAQPRNATYKFCGYNVKYDPAQGGAISPGAPSWIDLDTVSAAVWVDLPDVQGFIALGQAVDAIPGYPYEDGDTVPHVWYGPPICVHGQNGGPVSISVGPAAGSMVPKAWFYDPADLAKVAQGMLDPNLIAPCEEAALFNISPVLRRAHDAYQMGGAVFDAPTRSIFVSERAGEWPDPYSPSPVIHQFVIT